MKQKASNTDNDDKQPPVHPGNTRDAAGDRSANNEEEVVSGSHAFLTPSMRRLKQMAEGNNTVIVDTQQRDNDPDRSYLTSSLRRLKGITAWQQTVSDASHEEQDDTHQCLPASMRRAKRIPQNAIDTMEQGIRHNGGHDQHRVLPDSIRRAKRIPQESRDGEQATNQAQQEDYSRTRDEKSNPVDENIGTNVS